MTSDALTILAIGGVLAALTLCLLLKALGPGEDW